MNTKKIISSVLFLILTILTPALLIAESSLIKKTDFYYGFPVETKESAILYKINLTENIYSSLRRSDSQDIRIFNSEGITVPHIVRNKYPEITESEDIKSLSFYPVKAEDAQRIPNQKILIRSDTQGTVLNIDTIASGSRKITHYLIDASSLKSPVYNLQLKWTADNTGFIKDVTLQSGSEPGQWNTQDTGNTLADLTREGQKLLKNEVTVNDSSARYYLLEWPMSAEGVFLNEVKAVIKTQNNITDDTHWTEVSPEKLPNSSNEITFRVKGVFPVQSIKIDYTQNNSISQTKVYSRKPGNRKFTLRSSGLLYNLTADKIKLNQNELNFTETNDTIWKIEFSDPGIITKDLPKVSIGWRSEELIFLAKGSAPFIIAAGSDSTAAPDPLTLRSIEDVENSIGQDKISEAATGTRFSLNNLTPPEIEKESSDWGSIILWSVLIIGLLLLFFMVRSLMQQMKHKT
jgi:hypothetical protein